MNKKNTLLLLPLWLFVIYVTITSSSGGITGQSVNGCTCHTTVASGNTLVSISGLPAAGYTNGTVYALTVSVTNNVIVPFSGGFGLRDGFDMTASAGSFTAVAGTFLSGATEIGHNTPKTVVGGTASWTFNWTAPSSGNANVTFNVAGNATNGSGDNTGDQWNKTSVVIAKSGVALAVSATGSTINCNGGFSTITATGVGGSPTYTYKLNAGAFQSTNTFSGNLAGTYTITIKDVLSNTASTVLTINQPTLITSSASATPILCNGGTSTITVTASGGTGSLTYNKNGGTFQASNIFSANAAGNYTITARDANLCTKTTTLVITQPTAMTFTAPTLTTPLCNGGTGSVVISASGGTGSKTYTINPLGPQSNTTGNFTGLVAQTYTVTSTDANNCTKTTTLTLTQPALLSLGTVSITPPVCNGGSGSVSINASGGTGTKTFTISPSGPQSNTTGNFTGLVAQTYTITVTDANNCSKTSTVIMTEPAAQVVTATSLVACEGTPVTLVGSPAGGTFSLPNPYSGPGTTYTYTFTNGLGCTAVSAPASISRHTVTLDSITSTATYVCQGGNAFVSVKPHGQYCTPHNMFIEMGIMLPQI